MRCTWDMYLSILPPQLRESVDKHNSKSVLETRLRLGRKTEIITLCGSVWLDHIASPENLKYCVNMASRYSPWSSETVASGYITAPGGHRVGICGQAVVENGKIRGLRTVTSVCIRVAKDYTGIATAALGLDRSILILGRPGSGKTTLLRDLIRQLADQSSVSVIDERGELFPITGDSFCYQMGKRLDILSGCSKAEGIDMVLRTMTPDYIAVDEITAEADCQGLIRAGWCGVKLLATAHARDKHDLMNRSVYKPLINSGLFEYLLILRDDKSWRLERMNICC